ncbi:MAG: hypothetical protein ABSD90_13175 [Methylocystis sp.]|jgi:Holliday junction resolvase
MRDQTAKTYLGDGVYATFDGYQAVLTAENGVETTNRIYLEPETIGALIRFARVNGMIVVGQDARRRARPQG